MQGEWAVSHHGTAVGASGSIAQEGCNLNKGKEGEWADSYHGTAVGASGSIAQEGYNISKGKRFVYGRGIYTTPSVEVAAMYAQTFTHAGQKFRLVFQNRVSDKELKIVQSPHGEYWVQPQDELVRPYGICIRRV